ncbi:MAG TPA: branched-chain amino acid ABC transporter permease [Casimicrobiaceae bacterium]|nr:branched-chain amino acid ABC transporter permease [Casimicrobiaceae bacterium]
MTTLSIILGALTIGIVYACIALGFSVSMGACRVVNFAHGHFVLLGAYIAYFIVGLGAPVYAALPVAALVAGILGMAAYRFLIQPFAPSDAGLQIALTLGLAILLENAFALAFGPDPVSGSAAWPATSVWAFGNLRISVSRVIAGGAGLAIIAGIARLFDRNRWGMAIQAAGENVIGTELTGYPGRRVLMLGFGLSTALAGFAGVLLLPVANVSPFDAVDYTLRSFVVVLVAGSGNFRGILLVGILVGLLQGIGAYLASPDIATVLSYVLLLGTLWLRRVRSGGSALGINER